MTTQNDDANQADVRNGSEDVRNGSEQNENASERFGTVPNKIPVRSERVPNEDIEELNNGRKTIEHVPNESADVRNGSEDVPNEAEIVPNRSEEKHENVRNSSEDVPNASEQSMRNRSESFRTAPDCSEAHAACTITVREAARIFEEAGVPRTERAITNWCNRNARGVTRLDACYNTEERKYYISPNSISKVIQEERKKVQYTEYREGSIPFPEAQAPQTARPQSEAQVGDDPEERVENEAVAEPHAEEQPRETTHSREPKNRSEETDNRTSTGSEEVSEDERAKVKELQMENFELRVQLEGQKYLVRQFDSLVEGERERHEREKLSLVDRLTDARHQIGTLEQKLLQLGAGDAPVRDVEPEEPRVHEVSRNEGDAPRRSHHTGY
jgi:hypothetical protein